MSFVFLMLTLIITSLGWATVPTGGYLQEGSDEPPVTASAPPTHDPLTPEVTPPQGPYGQAGPAHGGTCLAPPPSEPAESYTSEVQESASGEWGGTAPGGPAVDWPTEQSAPAPGSSSPTVVYRGGGRGPAGSRGQMGPQGPAGDPGRVTLKLAEPIMVISVTWDSKPALAAKIVVNNVNKGGEVLTDQDPILIEVDGDGKTAIRGTVKESHSDYILIEVAEGSELAKPAFWAKYPVFKTRITKTGLQGLQGERGEKGGRGIQGLQGDPGKNAPLWPFLFLLALIPIGLLAYNAARGAAVAMNTANAAQATAGTAQATADEARNRATAARTAANAAQATSDDSHVRAVRIEQIVYGGNLPANAPVDQLLAAAQGNLGITGLNTVVESLTPRVTRLEEVLTGEPVWPQVLTDPADTDSAPRDIEPGEALTLMSARVANEATTHPTVKPTLDAYVLATVQPKLDELSAREEAHRAAIDFVLRAIPNVAPPAYQCACHGPAAQAQP